MAEKNNFHCNPEIMTNNSLYQFGSNELRRSCENQHDQGKSCDIMDGWKNFHLREVNQQPGFNLPLQPFLSSSMTTPRIDQAQAYSHDPSDSCRMATFTDSSTSGGNQGQIFEVQPPNSQVFPPFIPPVPFLPYTSYLPPFPPPSLQSGFPQMSSIDVSRPPPVLLREENTERSVQTWLKTHQAPSITDKIKEPKRKYNVSISEYKTKVAILSKRTRDMDKLLTRLQVMSKSLDSKEWDLRKTEILNQKALVEKAQEDLKAIPEKEILAALTKRRSKRARLKRKRAEFRELKKENKAHCQLEHSRIDLWLEKMKDQVETARRDEDIKKQADYVLAEVFHKKAEAKRTLTLLTTLGKLRNARIHDRESKGEFVSKEAAAAFNTIIESLKKRWTDQINSYSLEEKGLRVMLSDAEVKRSNVEISLNKQIHQQWLCILFGGGRHVTCATTVDQLVAIRKDWDKFIVGEEEIGSIGSSIPTGWVLPVPPSSEQWASFLKK